MPKTAGPRLKAQQRGPVGACDIADSPLCPLNKDHLWSPDADGWYKAGDAASGSPRAKSLKPIVILQHREGCVSHGITDFLDAGGWPWQLRRLWLDEPLPERPHDVAALIVLGGPMHAYEEEANPFLVPEKRFLRRALDEDLPMLGICLGAQLLAEVAGGHVYERDAEETGLLPVELVADDPLFAGVASPFVAFEHHSYSFSVPPHATLLARRPDGAQAFRLGRAWGLQFHPEVDLAAAVACTEERLAAGAEERPGDGAEAAAAASLRARLARLTPAYEQFCPRLLHNWLQLAA